MSWAEAKWTKDGILDALAVETIVPYDEPVVTLLNTETQGGWTSEPVLLATWTSDVTGYVSITVGHRVGSTGYTAGFIMLPRETTGSEFSVGSAGWGNKPEDTVMAIAAFSTTYVTDKQDVHVEEGITYYFYGCGYNKTYKPYYNLLTVGYKNIYVPKGGVKVGGLHGNVYKSLSSNASTYTLIDLKGSGYVEVYLRGAGDTSYGTKLSVKVDGIEKNKNDGNVVTLIGNSIIVYDILNDRLNSSNYGVAADTYGGISTQNIYPMIFPFSSSFTIELTPNGDKYVGARYVIRYFLT